MMYHLLGDTMRWGPLRIYGSPLVGPLCYANANYEQVMPSTEDNKNWTS